MTALCQFGKALWVVASPLQSAAAQHCFAGINYLLLTRQASQPLESDEASDMVQTHLLTTEPLPSRPWRGRRQPTPPP